VRIALLQTDIVWEDPAANFARLEPQLEAAAASGARLVVLPEMYACGFSMNTDKVAESLHGPSTTFLVDRAEALGVWICGSVPAKNPDADLPHNTFVLAGPSGELERYRKMHPFTFDREDEHYAAGDELLMVEVEGVRLTPLICYDLRFGEVFWGMADATDCYVVVANWPERRRMHWKTLLCARAIENQAYVVGLNRVGTGGNDGEFAYAGDSAVIDPWGEVLTEASRDPTMLLADVDPARVADARERFPVLRDRRTEL
jgi:predicted amidohydrolase